MCYHNKAVFPLLKTPYFDCKLYTVWLKVTPEKRERPRKFYRNMKIPLAWIDKRLMF